MTKAQMISVLAEKTNNSTQVIKDVLENYSLIIQSELKKEGEFKLLNYGKMKVVKREARIGRNPQTGEEIKIPAKTVVKFTFSKEIKESFLN